MEELVEFTKSLSPGISNMTRQVDGRREDLTNVSHAAMLEEETDQVMLSYFNSIVSMYGCTIVINQNMK